MWLPELPPFMPFLIIALLVFFTRGRLGSVLMLSAPIWGALNLWQLDQGLLWQVTLVELPLTPLRVDKLSLFFGYLFHLAAFFCIIYALHVRDKVQQLSCLLYTAAALGVVFAGDLLSVFIFWEMMALSSVFLIWARRSVGSLACGLRYLTYQVIFWIITAHRYALLLAASRQFSLFTNTTTGHRAMVDIFCLWHQMRLPDAAQLVDRRLPKRNTQRRNFFKRLHHESRCLYTGQRLCR